MVDVADMLKAVATGGWSAFDEVAIKAAQASEEARDREAERAEAAIVARALDNDAGRAFLEWVASKTILRPPSAADLEERSIEAYAMRQARREAQAQMFWLMQAALAGARGGDADAATDPAPVKRKRGKSDAA